MPTPRICECGRPIVVKSNRRRSRPGYRRRKAHELCRKCNESLKDRMWSRCGTEISNHDRAAILFFGSTAWDNFVNKAKEAKVMNLGWKRIVLLSGIILFGLTLTFAGCGKKEEPAPTPPAPSQPGSPVGGGETKAPADQPSGAPMEKKEEQGAKTK
jgi:hypothetical protein